MGQPNIIRYDFAAIQDAVRAMSQAIIDVQQETQTLRSDVTGLLEAWQGRGDDTFKEVKSLWDAASTNLNDAADLLTRTLDRVNQDMIDTEGGIVRLLKSHSTLG